MNIFIVEPSANGHRFHYLFWTAQAFLKAGHQVVIGTSDEYSSHSLLTKLQSSFPDQIHIISIPSRKIIQKFLIRETQSWLWFKSAYRKATQNHKIDFVFAPYMDYFLYATPCLGSPFSNTPFAGIIMTQTFHHNECNIVRPDNKKDGIEKFLFKRCLMNSHLRSALTIDPYLLQSSYSNDKIIYLPDPNSDLHPVKKSEARTALSLPENQKIILVFGSITPRKGINALFSAVLNSNIDSHILLVGRHDTATLQLLSEESAKQLIKQQKLSSINEFIPDELETTYYCAADIIWLGYQNHFAMSGVLIKSAACNRVVLGCKEGLIGKLTEEFDLGLTANINDPEDVARTLTRLIDENHQLDEEKRKAFAEEHNIEHFQKQLRNL